MENETDTNTNPPEEIEETSNLTHIPFDQSTIYYYNASKDNYHSKNFKKALLNIIIYIKLVPNNPKAFLLKGKIYMNLNQYQNGLNSFLRSIKLGENSIDVLYGMGRAYKELYMFEDSLKYYNQALKLEPTAKSHKLMAKCLYAMGKKENAIEIYDKILKINPNDVEAYFNKGICLSNLNLKEEAIQMYNKTIELNPNYIDAYFQRGYCYYNLKKYQKAMQEMNKVLQLDQNYYQAYYEKGFCFQKMKRYEEAIIEISKAIQLNRYFEKAYFQRGYCCELINDFSSAIEDYKKVIELNKNSYKVYFRLGLCYFYIKDYNEALNVFDKGISLNRANYDAYYFKGICQRYLKYYWDAIITFNFFLNCFVNNKSLSSRKICEEQISNVYYNKGRCLLSLGRYSEAIQMFNNYLKKNRNSYEVYFNRAICYYKSHKYKKAINDLTFIIKELRGNNSSDKKDDSKNSEKKEDKKNDENGEWDDDDVNMGKKMKKIIEEENDGELWAEIYFLRSKSYINLNQIVVALKDINYFFDLIEKEKNKIKKDILKSKGDKDKEKNLIKDNDKEDFDLKVEKIIFKKYDISEAHFKKGYCLLALLDYSSALKEFEKAIKIDPSYVTAYFNIGLCYYNLNDKKNAIKYFNKILEYYPLDIEAFINLVKCYREEDEPKNSYDLLIKKIPDFLKKEKNFLGKIPKLYYETGMSLFCMEKYDEAKIYFKKCRDYETNKNHKNDIQLISECYGKEGECASNLNKKDSDNSSNISKEN